MKSTATKTHINVLILLVGVFAFLALTISVTSLQYTKVGQTDQEEQIRALQADTARIRFCYDMQIQPCDDSSINKWNAEHPDEAFRITK